jgi:hypothetical protein
MPSMALCKQLVSAAATGSIYIKQHRLMMLLHAWLFIVDVESSFEFDARFVVLPITHKSHYKRDF